MITAINIKNAWRIVRNSKPTLYIFLLLCPMFIKPLAFSKTLGKPQPLYAKLPGLMAAPILVAAIYKSAFDSFYDWFFWFSVHSQKAKIPADELFSLLHSKKSLYSWGAFFFAAVTIYSLAYSHWLYHFGLIKLLKKWAPHLHDAPLKYFVVSTSAWALIFSGAAHLTVLALWKSEGNAQRISEYLNTHTPIAAVIFCAIGLLVLLEARNKGHGMKALYGDSALFNFIANAVFCCLLVLLAVAVVTIPRLL